MVALDRAQLGKLGLDERREHEQHSIQQRLKPTILQLAPVAVVPNMQRQGQRRLRARHILIVCQLGAQARAEIDHKQRQGEKFGQDDRGCKQRCCGVRVKGRRGERSCRAVHVVVDAQGQVVKRHTGKIFLTSAEKKKEKEEAMLNGIRRLTATNNNNPSN